MNITENVALACLLVLAMAGFSKTVSAQSEKKQPAPVETNDASIVEASLGDAKNVHRLENLFFSGQFSADDLQEIKAAKVDRIITLRTDGELDWDERAAVEDAGLEFEQVPVAGADGLTDEAIDKVRGLLKDKSKPTLLHCGSANRVGGVWLTWRVLDEGVDVETAIEEAKTIGLRSPAIQKKALGYIERKQAGAGAKEQVDDTKSSDALPNGK
ncbi:sulfur transferase domain-containing protein [Mariniblastus sp.]|nr:sulfur transferase domain-containing protein [Mariniblastus sp.]